MTERPIRRISARLWIGLGQVVLLRLMLIIMLSPSTVAWTIPWPSLRRQRHQTHYSPPFVSIQTVTFDTINNGNTHSDDITIHHHFMGLALQQAALATAEEEVPIGAVLVRPIKIRQGNAINASTIPSRSFEILAISRNAVELSFDASAHAELSCLRHAAKLQANWRLLNTTLYSTLEPCPMCLAACQAFRVDTVVYGAPDLRLGAVTTYMHMLDDYKHPFHNITTVVGGVRRDECAALLRDFFRQRRQSAVAADKASQQDNASTATSMQHERRHWLSWRRRRKSL